MFIYRRTSTGSYIRMDVKEIRRYKLQLLVSKFRTKKEAAEFLDMDYQVLYQLTSNKKRSSGKPYDMGDELARKTEKHIKKPRGWFDTLDDELTQISAETMLAATSLEELDAKDKDMILSLIQSLKSKKSPH